jgi:putative ABC transport system ATP-binding protein
MSETILEAKGVNKVLGRGAAQVHALRGIDLKLRGGELTILMGPSGSGKTTLLSVLGCMLARTAGTVEICGNSTDDADAERLSRLRRDHIGFIFQDYHLFPTLTAAENVQLPLDVRGVRGRSARSRAYEALARVGLAHKILSYPNELSRGEQQRVAIARAIVSDPAAILADEPTAALDSANGQAILGVLAAISHDPHRSVLVVTHDSRLTSFANRVITIEDGRLVDERRGSGPQPKLLTAAGAGFD